MSESRKKGHERRVEQRYAFYGEVPARIMFRGEALKFLIVDISRKGLGLLLTPCPEEGDEISLVFDDPAITPVHFTIKHLYRNAPAPSDVDTSLMRAGIGLAERNIDLDLIDIFTRHTAAVITD